MANVVTEHMLLLVPMMAVILLFPMATTFVVNNYNNEQRLIMVEEAGNQIGSTIQQVYLLMSLKEIQPCTLTMPNPLPSAIENQQYLITGEKVGVNLVLHFGFPGIPLWYDHVVTLGANAYWEGGTLDSNLPTAGIQVTKDTDGSIHLKLG